MSNKHLLAALLSGVALVGLSLVAEARDAKAPVRAEVPAVAAVQPVAALEDKAAAGQAAAEQIVQAPACARKVKVVYAGYGEASRAGCPAQAN